MKVVEVVEAIPHVVSPVKEVLVEPGRNENLLQDVLALIDWDYMPHLVQQPEDFGCGSAVVEGNDLVDAFLEEGKVEVR